MNQEIEPEMKSTWQLETGMRRVGLRTKPGMKPKWLFTEKTGKLVRKSKGGVDFYRYCHVSVSFNSLPSNLNS
jgi:hypothetical protein